MLYLLQHKMLPELLYLKKEEFLFSLLRNAGGMLVFFWNSLVAEHPAPAKCPFSAEEIKACKKDLIADGRRAVIVAVVFPEPDVPPMCRCVYFCCDETGRAAYFTSEKSFDSSYALCGWDENEAHINYGKYIDTFEEELAEVESIFCGR